MDRDAWCRPRPCTESVPSILTSAPCPHLRRMSLRKRRVPPSPRPPAIEPETRCIRIVLGGQTIAETTRALRILETFHPPTYYLPPDAFRRGALILEPGHSFCEWKGAARYLAVSAGAREEKAAAWTYP